MHRAQLLLLLLAPAFACAGAAQYVPPSAKEISDGSLNLRDYSDNESREDNEVLKLIDRAKARIDAKEKTEESDPHFWWRENAVVVLEQQKLQPTRELVAACMHTAPSDSSYLAKGRVKPEWLFPNDVAVYKALRASHNQIAEMYVPVRALTQEAAKHYSYKDDFQTLALRGLIAFQRLIDHHRFILYQISQYDCLSTQVPVEIKLEDDALRTFQAMVKNYKHSGEMINDLQRSFVDQEFNRLSKALADKKAYAGSLDIYGFLYRVYGENTEEVEKECRSIKPEARQYAFKAYACGYVVEKNGHDSKASKFYAEAKKASIDYAGPAASRTRYLEEWNGPLQTEEQRKAEGPAQYQRVIEQWNTPWWLSNE